MRSTDGTADFQDADRPSLDSGCLSNLKVNSKSQFMTDSGSSSKP